MGKDLKGKELGVGINQQKNGLYSARYVIRWELKDFLCTC